MFKFPDWPHTLVVRHLECISCKHMLEISEGDIDNRGRVRSLVPRYTQHPNQAAARENQPDADRVRTVDCPRCGADNRNWLYLSLRPYIEQIPRWGRILMLLLTVGLVLAGPIWLILRQTDKNKLDTRNVALIIVAYLAIILPILILSPRWRDLRDHKYLQRVTGLSWRHRISPLWRDGLLLVFLLAVIVPVSRYLLFPVAQNQLELFVAPETELEGSARVTQLLGSIGNGDVTQLDTTALALSVSNIQRILEAQELCQMVAWRIARARLEQVKQMAVDPADTAVITDVLQNLDKALAGGTCRPAYFEIAGGILQEYQKQLSLDNTPPQCHTIADKTKRDLCWLNEQLQANLPQVENANTEQQPVESANAEQQPLKWDQLAKMKEEDILVTTRQTLSDLRQFWAVSDTFPAQDQIDAELDNIERLFESRTLQNKLAQNVDFVLVWMKLVGISGIAATFIAIFLAKHEEKLYDPNLPRPVFNSVAAMAPTVIWELNETVGLPVNANRIQWMNIERNGQGGVTLTGLYRNPQNSGDNMSNQVRGQEFIVQTDPWCYIQNTTIKDVMVAPPLSDDKPPAQSMANNGSAPFPAFAVNNGRIQST